MVGPGWPQVTTCTVAGRAYVDVSRSRSRCRPVRLRRWRALPLPAGAALGWFGRTLGLKVRGYRAIAEERAGRIHPLPGLQCGNTQLLRLLVGVFLDSGKGPNCRFGKARVSHRDGGWALASGPGPQGWDVGLPRRTVGARTDRPARTPTAPANRSAGTAPEPCAAA
jgi:hypothetical protein